jgi:hypothetical protein
MQSPDYSCPHPGSLIVDMQSETFGVVTKWDKVHTRVHITWCKPVWGQMTSVESESNVTWSHLYECLGIIAIPF